jgi:hypothetical protein
MFGWKMCEEWAAIFPTYPKVQDFVIAVLIYPQPTGIQPLQRPEMEVDILHNT